MENTVRDKAGWERDLVACEKALKSLEEIYHMLSPSGEVMVSGVASHHILGAMVALQEKKFQAERAVLAKEV